METLVTSRRKFIKDITIAGLTLGMAGHAVLASGKSRKRIGIIGLDTSHSIEFTKALNDPKASPEFAGYKVVAAYPKGSNDIESSVKRIPQNIEEIKKYGVRIAKSIDQLLDEVDAVLLETNDGRLHLQQASQVFKTGKPVFIDKPVAASLRDVITIFETAKKYSVPVFSSSSLRYITGMEKIIQGKAGKVLGADVYSPAYLEKNHPDLFWYGVHGVEMLFAALGTGCKEVSRIYTENTDVVTAVWQDNRIGTFRGLRSGNPGYGGTVYGETAITVLGPFQGYSPLLIQIVNFFETKKAPVNAAETIEIYAFMEAAEESKKRGGVPVTLESVINKAKNKCDLKG